MQSHLTTGFEILCEQNGWNKDNLRQETFCIEIKLNNVTD